MGEAVFPRMVKATVLLSQSGSPSSARRGEGAEEQALAVLVLGGSDWHTPSDHTCARSKS